MPDLSAIATNWPQMTRRNAATHKRNNGIHSLDEQTDRLKSKDRDPTTICMFLIIDTLSIITTRRILLVACVVDHGDLKELINHLLRQRINPRLQHLESVLIILSVLAIALTALAAVIAPVLVVLLLTLPHHDQEEGGDEVDGKETTNDGQQTL